MFTVLDGEVQVTFRGETLTARAGETINVPANAPHAFTNATGTPSRLLCLCAPAGQEEFFTLVGQPVATRTAGAAAARRRRAGGLHRQVAERSPPSTRPNCCRRPARSKGRVPR